VTAVPLPVGLGAVSWQTRPVLLVATPALHTIVGALLGLLLVTASTA